MIRYLLMGCVPLAGCVNMSGLDGGSRYACAAPDGVACDSVSGTYTNAVHHNLPSQRSASSASAAQEVAASAGTTSAASGGGAPPRPVTTSPGLADATMEGDAGTPLRSPARVLRLWTKPWEDADGDLWDQGYVYVQVDGGRWQLEHVRQRIRERHQPLRPPPAPAPGTAAPGAVPGAVSGAAAEPPAEGLPRGSAASPFGNFPSFNRPMAVPGQQP